MQRPFIFASLLLLMLFSSCEEIIDVEGLPYEERLVINGTLYAHRDNNVIQITKTMPLNVRFDSNVAFLKDAVGSITSDGVTYPLEYVGYSALYRARGLRAEIGKTYSLNVQWRDLMAEASTVIPAQGRIDSAWLTERGIRYGFKEYGVDVQGNLDAETSALFDVATHGHYVHSSNNTAVYYSYSKLQNAKKDSSPTIFKSSIDLWTQEEIVFDSIKAKMTTYAPGYHDYYYSRQNEGDEIPGGSPAPVKWNVSGQAIGIFFGAAVDSATFRL